jgi:hypothetical protein
MELIGDQKNVDDEKKVTNGAPWRPQKKRVMRKRSPIELLGDQKSAGDEKKVTNEAPWRPKKSE